MAPDISPSLLTCTCLHASAKICREVYGNAFKLSTGSEEAKGKPSRLRGKQPGQGAEGNLLDMPCKVLLKGQASAVLSAALAGKAGSADALACQGIFDR